MIIALKGYINMEKTGIGIITYNRPDYFAKCIASVPKTDMVVVVNDGKPYETAVYPDTVSHLIQHNKNMCVGISKNEAMKYMVENGCEHIFIMEDDMEILDLSILETYIRASKASGIMHMNYGPGSPWNRKGGKKEGVPEPRMTVDYGGVRLSFYKHTVAMFSYFRKCVLEKAGYHDENFHNAWEHIELTARIIHHGFHTPFWWFADIAESSRYIREQENAIENSSILKDRKKWEDNIRKGIEYHIKKYGIHPTQYEDVGAEKTIECLKMLKRRAG